MITRHAKPEEKGRIDELFSIAFEYPMEDGPVKPMEDDVHYWAAFTDNNEMMSCFTITDFQQNFDGSGCKMGGIGGVATLPAYRRHGGIRSCFEHALPEMYKENYDLSYLYPFSTAYYRKFGYENCVQRYQVVINLGLLKPNPTGGHFILAEQSRPLTDEIRAIDAVWEKEFNMMVRHDEGDYDWIKKTDPPKKQEYTYVCFDSGNHPVAYTTFRMQMQPDGRNLVCSRLAFLNTEGYNILMSLFKSLAADHALVKFQLPALPAMEYLMPEWSLGAAHWELVPAGMVRVINVREIFRKAVYRGSGEALIAVSDPQIEENSGTWHVVFENGKAVNVELTEEEPEIAMKIETFSALICGVMPFSDAVRWMPGLRVLRETPDLEKIFYQKPQMIVDYF